MTANEWPVAVYQGVKQVLGRHPHQGVIYNSFQPMQQRQSAVCHLVDNYTTVITDMVIYSIFFFLVEVNTVIKFKSLTC